MPTDTKPIREDIPSELSPNTRAIRLYSVDDKDLIWLHSVTKKLNRKMDIVDLIRDCIQAGLPIVKERWEPLTKGKKGMNHEKGQEALQRTEPDSSGH